MGTIKLVSEDGRFEEILREAMAQKMREAMLDGNLQDLIVARDILTVFQSKDVNNHAKLLLAEMFNNLAEATVDETKLVNSICSLIYDLNESSKEDMQEKLARGLIVFGNVLLKV